MNLIYRSLQSLVIFIFIGFVYASPPDWDFGAEDAANYEFTATLTGVVDNGGEQLGDVGDLLAAFDSDGELRGLGTKLLAPFGPYSGSTFYELQIYSDNAGDVLNFKYYDASLDEILSISNSYDFIINDVAGSFFDPYVFGINSGFGGENIPDWSFNFAEFLYTSTLTAVVFNDEGVQLSGDGDIMAAFSPSGDVRGIGTQLPAPFGPYAGTVLFEIEVYSDETEELLTFQYYDASEDTILPIDFEYLFTPNDITTGFLDPVIFNIQTDVDLTIDLITGWNWISFNVDPEETSVGSILADLGDAAAIINSQSSGTSQNYGDYGWYGGLSDLSAEAMYLIKMNAPATLTVTGAPVDVANRPIEVITGWNWIGYMAQNPGDVGTALAGLGDAATIINSQSSGTSQNYGDYGWYGGLSTLQPGSGYLLKMNAPGTLIYPSFDAMSRLDENKGEVELVDTISDWDFNYSDYEFIGTITASVESRSGSDGDLLGVFVDGECRGISERMYFPFNDSYVYSVQVYSSIADGEEMTFKYYDALNDVVVSYEERVTFTNNMVIGDGFNTLALNREFSDSIQPEEFGLSDAYPNPFNPVTNFIISIPYETSVNVSIYDMQGRKVETLLNKNIKSGYFSLGWNAQDYVSGIYFLKLKSEKIARVKKIILLK